MKYSEFIANAEKIGVNRNFILEWSHNPDPIQAKLQKEGSLWFICQDTYCGSSCMDRLGHLYSYVVISNGDSEPIRKMTSAFISEDDF